MSSTITLTGSCGQSNYKVTGLDAGTLIDAETASWIVDNSTADGDGANAYPFEVFAAPDVIIDGGTIIGEIDQTAEFYDIYVNSAAIRTEDCPGASIQDWRISQAWDAIRVSWDCQDFVIQDVWVSDNRDDAVENDRLNSGIVRDSLFDGTFAGISLDPSSSSPVDGHNETVTLDGVLMRMEKYNYEGEMTHASFIKTDSATPGTVTPNLRFIDNVIAIEDVNHHSYRSLEDAWNNTVESSGNYYLNLSDTPLPSDYPMPPAGWTVLQGQAARDYWDEARSTWIEKHQGTAENSNDGNAGPAPDQGTAETPSDGNVGPAPDQGTAETPSDGNEGPALDLDGSTGGTGFTAQVFEKKVVSGLDDVEQRGHRMSTASSDLELVQDHSYTQLVGLRFTGMEIPEGAIINKAYIQFQTDEGGSAASSLIVRGEDTDDAAAFANVSDNLSSRATTDASVAWTPEGWNTVGQAGLSQRTADLSDIVEEIVSRPGWQSGNDMAFTITGSGQRTAEAFESGAATAPLLHIEFSMPTSSPELTYNGLYVSGHMGELA